MLIFWGVMESWLYRECSYSWKVSFQSQRKAMSKNAQTIIWHASKLMLKILQARLQQYINWELPDVQDRFRKDRITRDWIANKRWIIENTREFQKNGCFWFIDYTKAFECVDHKKTVENSSRDGNTRTPYLPPEKYLCRSKSNS